ncbi:MAG: PilZ domain-containing protein [Candidatus Omnitrophota bacterium]
MRKKKCVEKRRFPRLNLVALAIIKCDIRVNIAKGKELEFHTHTENLSEGGVNVIIEAQLPKLTPVELKLFVTGKRYPVECKGHIVWSELVSPPGVNPSIFSTGIEITEYKSDGKEALVDVISCFSDRKT